MNSMEAQYIKIMTRKFDDTQREFIAISWYKKDLSKLILRTESIAEIMLDLEDMFTSQNAQLVKKNFINLLEEMRSDHDKQSLKK